MTDSEKEKTPSVTDLSGRQLGDFRILRRIGRGAMAEVYLAEQEALRRRVAFKILKPDLAKDRTYLKRFQVEARAAASLVHANIVQIHEVGHVDEFHYIAQEYVQGQNLQEWTDRNGPPSLPQTLSIMRQVASALAKAAEHGIVHRDIKPENILITRDGEVKVADFGLARIVRQSEGVDLTQVGMTLGTPLYMSPEQVEGKPLDPRSDIYSLGVTCYQMMAGTPPFQGETALGVAVQHLKKQPESLDGLRPDLPPPLCRLVHRMLAKDRDKRFPSARELLRELHRLHREHCDDWPEDLPNWETSETASLADTRVETARQLDTLMKASAGRRRRFTGAVLGLAISVALLLGGIFGWQTVNRPSLLSEIDPIQAEIPDQGSALLQYLHASRIGTEEAWKSVIERYGDRQYVANRAKQQLARLHLGDGDYRQAMAIFDELAWSNEEERELRAFGLVGQYCILILRKEYTEAGQVLDELWPLRYYLRDPQMDLLFRQALQKHRTDLQEIKALQWDEFISDHFPEAD